MRSYVKELEEKVRFLQQQSDLYSLALHTVIGSLGALHDFKMAEPRTEDEIKAALEKEFKGLNLRREK